MDRTARHDGVDAAMAVKPDGIDPSPTPPIVVAARWPGPVGVGLLVVIVAIVFRLPGIDRLVTTDEELWLGRSANFYQALHDRDWEHTYQFSHPGVTVTWLGALGYWIGDRPYAAEVGRQLGDDANELGSKPAKAIGPTLEQRGVEPFRMLVLLRTVLVVAIGAALGLAAAAFARILGWLPALAGGLLVAVDPFTTAHSRLLHLDGLSAALLLLAVAQTMVFALRGRHLHDMALAGAFAGLACLTRMSGLVLVPVVGLVVLGLMVADIRRRSLPGRLAAGRALGWLAVWAAAAAATFSLLWPAMIVDPAGTLLATTVGAQGLADAAHANPVFFDGRVTDQDPGASFYLINYLWRTTPAVLVGLLLAGLLLAMPRGRTLVRSADRATVAVLVVFAMLFALGVTAEAKKFDRYLLPVFPALAIVAGWGWVAVARALPVRGRFLGRQISTIVPALLAAVAVGSQFAVSLPTYPYYLSYYNPLLGGAAAAQGVMMVGRGEGYADLAAALEALPGGETLRIIADPDKLGPFFSGEVLTVERAEETGRRDGLRDAVEAIRAWVAADAEVHTISGQQRNEKGPWSGSPPPGPADHLLTTVSLQGLTYFWVYGLQEEPIPLPMLKPPAPATVWDGTLTLAAVVPPDEGRPNPTTLTAVLSRRKKGGANRAGLEIVVSTVSRQGVPESVAVTRLDPPPNAAAWEQPVAVDFPPDLSEGATIEVGIRQLGTGVPLVAEDMEGRRLGTSVAVARVQAKGQGRALEMIAPTAGSASASPVLGMDQGTPEAERERSGRRDVPQAGQP